MRVLVISEKAATPEINWYKFQKRSAGCRYAIWMVECNLTTLWQSAPPFAAAGNSSVKSMGKTFYWAAPATLPIPHRGGGGGVKSSPIGPRSNDSMLHASRLGAHEDNLERLLDDDLIVDAG